MPPATPAHSRSVEHPSYCRVPTRLPLRGDTFLDNLIGGALNFLKQLVAELMKEIADEPSNRTIARVPQSFPLLRTVQFTLEHVVDGGRVGTSASHPVAQ